MDSKASTETAAKLRQLFQERGAINQETEQFLFRLEKGVQVEVAPGWLTDVNIVTFLLGVGLLVFSVVRG